MTREAGLAVLLLLAIGLLWITNSRRGDAVERALTAEAAVRTLALARDSVQQRADSLASRGAGLDSVVFALRDSAAVYSARTDTVLRFQRDTLRVLVRDTVAVRLLDQRDSIFTERHRLDSLAIDSLTVWGLAWRASSFAKDTVIARFAEADSLWRIANEALRDELRSKTRRQWGERVVTLGALACAALCR